MKCRNEGCAGFCELCQMYIEKPENNNNHRKSRIQRMIELASIGADFEVKRV